MPDMILVFDTSAGYPATCRGLVEIPPPEAGLTDLEEAIRALGSVDVDVRRGDPETYLGINPSAITIASPSADPIVNARAVALDAASSALAKAKAGATDTLLEALLRIVTTPGVIDETPLKAADLAILQRLRDDVAAQLSVAKAGALDDAVEAKNAQKAILDTIPTAAAVPV